MFSFLLYMLLAWFLYNLVFRFIIPIYRATRKMKSQFADMQSAMRDKMNQQAMGGARHAYASNGNMGAGEQEKPGNKGAFRSGGPFTNRDKSSGSPLTEDEPHQKPSDEYIDFEELK